MAIHILFAVVLDRLIGDPPNWPHPIRFYGRLISLLEKFIRAHLQNLKFGGFLLVLGSVTGVLVPFEILRVILPSILFNILSVYMLMTSLASKCLHLEAQKVIKAIETDDIELARLKLSYLVGRDTKNLSLEEIMRGVIETVAENTIDGVLAPLFMMMIGLPFGLSVEFAIVYKIVNTLDSMVGYIHEPYKDIGFASAKLDDALNFIPARFGALIMLLAGGILKLNVKNGFKVFCRDRQNHKSPNSGHPESVVAGLLNIQIGGTNQYFGNIVVKPTIGDAYETLSVEKIKMTSKIMFASMWILMLFGGLVYVSFSIK
ncbi:adenosylcobinamide-phosphate synthase CbiB [Fusibacter bizertensis]